MSKSSVPTSGQLFIVFVYHLSRKLQNYSITSQTQTPRLDLVVIRRLG
jgi:hypothetical protein